MIANIVRICQGFLNTASSSESIAYFNDSSKPTSVIRSCVFDAQSLLLDGVVVSLRPVYEEYGLIWFFLDIPSLGGMGERCSNYILAHARMVWSP